MAYLACQPYMNVSSIKVGFGMQGIILDHEKLGYIMFFYLKLYEFKPSL